MKSSNPLQNRRSAHALRYLYREYIVSVQYVMPLVALFIFMLGLYSVSPFLIVDSHTISMVFIFLLMVWISLSYHSNQNTVLEQLTILKLKRAEKVYLLQAVFLLLICMSFSLLLVLFPVGLHFFRVVYKRPITAWDILISIFLHGCAGYVGSALGGILHPRIIPNRVISISTAVMVSLLCIVKPGVHSMLPPARYVTWLLPPVAEFCARFAGKMFYDAKDVAVTALQLIVYGTILTGAKTALLARNRF